MPYFKITPEEIVKFSELRLLAAIAYGESHWSNVYEEMAGIASAVIRRRDAANFDTVNQLVVQNKSFSYVVYNGNERFLKLLHGEKRKYEQAYIAAFNALNYGEDFSNEGCFWDGYDLKVSGTKHYRYRCGFRYSDPSHNIFGTPEPPIKSRQGSIGIFYFTYVSTATQGRTIFWKLDQLYLDANAARQGI